MLVVFPFSMECGASFRLILFIITIHCTAASNDISSFCTTHHVYENESVNISCHFSEDIRLIKRDGQVNVVKVGASEPIPIVIYSWINGGEIPEISVKPGYECVTKLTNTLTINIPSATQNHSGEYKCLVGGIEYHNFTSCSLFVEGQLNPQDVHLTCPKSDLFNGTQINLICTVLTNYSSKCAALVQEVEFRVSYDENAYTPSCKIMNVSKCDFSITSKGCGCIIRRNTHYTLMYTFIGAVSHNITWDCSINCSEDSLNPALSFESKFCRRRNIEIIPEHTTVPEHTIGNTFNSTSNGDQSLGTGLIIGIVVGVIAAVIFISAMGVVLKFKEEIRSKLQCSDCVTPKEKVIKKEETDKLVSINKQEEKKPEETLDMKAIEELPKPVPEKRVASEEETDY